MTQSMTLPVIWLTVVLAAIFLEAIFENLVAVWFAPAAAVALVGGLFSVTPRGQVIMFTGISFLLILAVQTVRSLHKHFLKHKHRRQDIE